MPARLKDIARDLNLSVVTISKVLRDHPDIVRETRERVLKRTAKSRKEKFGIISSETASIVLHLAGRRNGMACKPKKPAKPAPKKK